tara:strand:- start:343 stop:1038 length:696 start_codon:yes stop_codon:yes gene_type:complete
MFEQFQIIAHRGFSGKYPENTMLSFDKAIEAGATMLEFDLQLTKDNDVVVFHDECARRLCNRQLTVRYSGRDALKELDVGGEEILFLDEVLDRYGDSIYYYIELKMWENVSVAYKTKLMFHTISEITKRSLQNNCVIVSFDPLVVHWARRLGYNNVGINYTSGKKPVFNAKVGCVKHTAIKQCVDNEIIYAWTTNNRRRMKKLIEYNVNGIVTDHPDRLKEVYDSCTQLTA